MFLAGRTGIRALCLVGVLLSAGLERAAASSVIEDRNTWLQLAITGPLLGSRPEARPWRYALDSPNRFGNNSRQYSQGAWRAGIGYMLNQAWSVWAGCSYTYTDTPYTRAPFGEPRGYQQLTWTGRASAFNLQHRFRFEEKFPATGHDMGLRVRHQFRVSHPIPGIRPLAWVWSEEVFFNLNATDYGARRGLDQNRTFAGFAWQWSEHTRSEVGYLHHFTNRSGQPNRVNHVLAVSLALAFR